MAAGIVFHDFIDSIAFVAPYLIFVMLLVTYCRIRPRQLQLTRYSLYLVLFQVFVAVGLWLMIRDFDAVVAQGVFICVFCPVATAAPVITGMLGGNVARLATFSLVSNGACALLAPLLFTAVNPQIQIDVIQSMQLIAMRVVPMILAPLAVAFILLATVPRVHATISSHQGLSFYIWAVSLFIVVGRAVSFVINEPSGEVPEMIWLAIASLVVCCLQFYIGRRIGGRLGDKVSGAQGLGQKNTVLAIWMALTYMNPLSSVAPAAYVAWQNTINSLQLYYKAKREQSATTER